MSKRDDFAAYIQRFCRTRDLKPAQALKLKIVREVGKSYGLTDAEMDEERE